MALVGRCCVIVCAHGVLVVGRGALRSGGGVLGGLVVVGQERSWAGR